MSDILFGNNNTEVIKRLSIRYFRKNKNRNIAAILALSELWVFQEKVDMKVSAFSFTSALLIFGYL